MPKANTKQLDAKTFITRLHLHSSPEDQRGAQRFFKTGKGEYGEGDIFIGVRNGLVNALAKEFIEMPLNEVEILLKNPIHEIRSGALGIMDLQARMKKTPESRRKELFDIYMRCIEHINNWDLVDKSAPHVVGGYLFSKPRKILYKLAASKKLWERRTAIVSTLFFIRQNDLETTFDLAVILLHDKHDLIHKATGWMLRCAGLSDKAKLLQFLDQHAAAMPRTMLRYAIEHFDEKERFHYMRMGKGS